MNFLAPAAFALGVLMPVIVALYLLKLRRVEREVSSTYLWRKMVRDVEANAPWQKLRPNLLMMLQLFFLFFLILALARPFTWVEGAGGDAAIFIIDTSASMSATDVAPSRLDSARQRASQLIDDLPGNARVTIIEAGREAQVLLSSSLDRRQAHLAIDRLHPGTGNSDMAVSLELASAIASRQPGTEILVLSDGRVSLPQHLSIKGTLRFIPFGLNGENQGISLLNLEPAAGNAGLTAFVQITNYGEKSASRRVSLFADGMLVNVYDLNDIRHGGQENIIAEGLPVGTKLVEAQLDGQDILSLDDRAVAAHPDVNPVQVTLVSPGNLFLRTGLSLLPGVEYTEQEINTDIESSESDEPVSPEPAAESQPQETNNQSTVALWIFDSYVPNALPDSGNMLFIAPPSSTEYFVITGTVEAPEPRIVDPSDPLVNNVVINQVSILDSAVVALPEWATPVIAGEFENGNTPLLFRGEIDGRRIAVISFDLRRSDLPLQVAFPLLLTNLVDWLAPGAGSAVPEQALPGESLTFHAPDDAQSVMVTRPDGSTLQLQAENGHFVLTDTEQLGVYNLHFQNSSDSPAREAAFVVNLFSAQESNIHPAANLPGLETQSAQSGTGQQRSMREWWRTLALVALGLLFGEWLVYQRAALVRLRDKLAALKNSLPLRLVKRKP